MVILEVEEELIMHSSSVVSLSKPKLAITYLQVFIVLKVLTEVAKYFNQQFLKMNYSTIFPAGLFIPSPQVTRSNQLKGRQKF